MILLPTEVMISVTLGWISPYGRNGVKEAPGGVSLTLDITAQFSVDMIARFIARHDERFFVDMTNVFC